MDEVFREAVTPYEDAAAGVPWPWSAPDGAWHWELFCALPEDGNRYEVIAGRLEMSPPPRVIHQRVSGNLYALVREWSRRTGAGEVFLAPLAVILPNTASYLEPDLIFVAREHRSIITPDHVQGTPDLVVEILSPGSVRADWVDKKAVYEKALVPRYWVVDPEAKTLTAFRLDEGRYQLEGRYTGEASFTPEGLPDLAVDLAALWD